MLRVKRDVLERWGSCVGSGSDTGEGTNLINGHVCRTSRLARHFRTVATASIALLLLANSGVGAATLEEPRTIDDLEKAFSIDDLRSDFVVVIDSSGSMADGSNPLFPQVRNAYKSLVDALPIGNRLSVITFDSTPTVVFDAAISRKNQAAAQSALDRIVPAGGTDLGSAISNALNKLERADAAQLATLIFMTDGEQHAGGQYADVNGGGWRALTRRAGEFEKSRPSRLAVRAIGLSDGGRRGAELVKSVFATSDTEIVQLPSDQLRAYLAAEAAKARRRSLIAAITDELRSHPIKATLTTDGTLTSNVKVKVTLRSSLEHLGVDVDLKRVVAVDNRQRSVRSSIVGGSRTIHLPPAGSADFEVVVKPEVSTPDFFELPPERREEIDVTLRFSESAHAAPTELLEQTLRIDTDVAVTQPDTFTAGRTLGKSWFWFITQILLSVLALLLAFYVWWRWIKLPPLTGQLLLTSSNKDSSGVPLKGKKMVIDGATFGSAAGGSRAKLYTRRGKRGRVFAQRVGLDGTFERQDGYKWKPFSAGSELSSVGRYRLDQNDNLRFWRRIGSSEE